MASALDDRLQTPEQRALRAEVARRIEADGVRKVRLATVDLNGIPRSKMVAADVFVNRVMEHGHPWAIPLIAVDIWQNLPERSGYGPEVGYGNGRLVPDLATFRKLPWTADTAHVWADVYTAAGEGTPTPRQVLASTLERAEEGGRRVVFGSEMEFYVFRPGDGKHPANPGFEPFAGMQVWSTDQGIGQAQDLLDELFDHFCALEIPIQEMFNEHGGGQFEFNLAPAEGLAAIDAACLMKVAIKEVCQRRGLRATFMGKPTNGPEFPVSGYHLHQSLLGPDGAELLSGDEGPLFMSDLGRSYVGGILEHTAGLTALAAPTVTAYKRFTPGTWAPTRASWGLDNRTAMIRVIRAGGRTRIENRLPSSDAVPYLIAAGMTAAGLAGVEAGADPGEPGEGNLLEDERFPLVPTSLVDAADAFARDEALVAALGEDFARIYVGLLRYVWGRFLSHVTDWEIQEYRDLL